MHCEAGRRAGGQTWRFFVSSSKSYRRKQIKCKFVWMDERERERVEAGFWKRFSEILQGDFSQMEGFHTTSVKPVMKMDG